MSTTKEFNHDKIIERQNIDAITDGNKLIMVFDGWELKKMQTFDPSHNGDKNDYLAYIKDGKQCKVEDVEFDIVYHQSWAALMPVIEQIMSIKIGNGIETVEYAFLRTFGMLNAKTGYPMVRFNGFQLHESNTLIKATHLAVVDFIKWFNGTRQNLRERTCSHSWETINDDVDDREYCFNCGIYKDEYEKNPQNS